MKKSKILASILTLVVMGSLIQVNPVNAKYGIYGYKTIRNKPSYFIPVKTIWQRKEGAPMGCEGASALSSLWQKGKAKNISYHTFLNRMPKAKDNNPYHGFVGSPYRIQNNLYQSIFPSALVPYIKKYGNVKNSSGYSPSQLIHELHLGHTSVVYVTFKFVKPYKSKWKWGTMTNHLHVMLLNGYDYKTHSYHVMDPIYGQYWVNWDAFRRAYNSTKMAITIL